MSIGTYSLKIEKCWNQTFFTLSHPRIARLQLGMSNFDSDSLTCDHVLFSAKNCSKVTKSNVILPGKGRGDRALVTLG